MSDHNSTGVYAPGDYTKNGVTRTAETAEQAVALAYDGYSLVQAEAPAADAEVETEVVTDPAPADKATAQVVPAPKPADPKDTK